MTDPETRAEERLVLQGLAEVLGGRAEEETRAEREIRVREPRLRPLLAGLDLAAVAVLAVLLFRAVLPAPAPVAGEDATTPRLVFALEEDGDPGAVAAVFRRRLELGGWDAAVTLGEDGRVRVDFAGSPAEPELARAAEVLGRPGTLEFLAVAPADRLAKERTKWRDRVAPPAPEGWRWVPDRNPEDPAWLLEIPEEDAERFTSRDLDPDEVGIRPEVNGAGYILHFAVREKRKRAFESFTRGLVGRLLAIVIDGRVVVVPRVQAPLPGRGQISGGGVAGFTKREAEDLKLLLGAPPLPARITLIEQDDPEEPR